MSEPGDLLARVRGLSSLAPFNVWLGLELVRAAPGEVDFSLRARAEFMQPGGSIHASIVGSLIDTACAFAAITLAGKVLLTSYSVRFLAPAAAETFAATGRVTAARAGQIFATAVVYEIGAPEKPFASGDAVLVPPP